ncbi:hypothetical protein HYALB_00012549 [Hymenoscyphus albidus]|uniref:endo-1,3(4)-beta-glucanase n=1 Tax=Hymenoscyphus albidus TaxID=595503 RepID=A0A9N9LY61_9HELO|nr:hypothetical protein HYALB_00012549 [Hymenoscyphus albidus]
MAQPQNPGFKPLEYWKPPKPVRHFRSASKTLSVILPKIGIPTSKVVYSPSVYSSYPKSLNPDLDDKQISISTVEMAKEYDNLNSQKRPWYDAKGWGKKAWIGIFIAFVIIVIVVVVPSVVVTRNNRYPDYTRLNYTLTDTYSGENFFDNFNYFPGPDPTEGFVKYVDQATAQQYNLTYASSRSSVIRVDTTLTNTSSVPNTSTGRMSIRLSSKKQFGNNNLFIFDVKHTPLGCAVWPALWLTDDNNWPDNGEIDLYEAINVIGDHPNQITLHTTKGCVMNVKRKQTGKALQKTCLNSTNVNAGCGVDPGPVTFGQTYNNDGGGIMAMELRREGIRAWQFRRSSIPSDITNGNPDPSTWGTATADFPSTNCDINTHFRNQSIILNISLCGTWAGRDYYKSADTCPGSCEDHVAANNTAFRDAYWEFGTFSVYNSGSR